MAGNLAFSHTLTVARYAINRKCMPCPCPMDIVQTILIDHCTDYIKIYETNNPRKKKSCELSLIVRYSSEYLRRTSLNNLFINTLFNCVIDRLAYQIVSSIRKAA